LTDQFSMVITQLIYKWLQSLSYDLLIGENDLW